MAVQELTPAADLPLVHLPQTLESALVHNPLQALVIATACVPCCTKHCVPCGGCQSLSAGKLTEFPQDCVNHKKVS